MKCKVKFSAEFVVDIDVDTEAGDSLNDAITDIDIPENECKYFEDSFTVVKVTDENDKELVDWWRT